VQEIPSKHHKLIPVLKRVNMHSKNCTIQEPATSVRFGNNISVQKRTITFW